VITGTLGQKFFDTICVPASGRNLRRYYCGLLPGGYQTSFNDCHNY
jgi:hypothetical protein